MVLLLVAVAVVVVADLPEDVRTPARSHQHRRFRRRVLERRRPQCAVPAREPGARRRRAGACLLRRGFANSPSIASRARLPAATMDSARRAMRASYQREIDALEANLAGLATVGSVSPYIGLFGTVWGIMNAFRGPAERQPGDACTGRAGHRRSADRHCARTVRGHSGGRRLQPLHARRRSTGDALRDLHRGILQHPAAAGMKRAGSDS